MKAMSNAWLLPHVNPPDVGCLDPRKNLVNVEYTDTRLSSSGLPQSIVAWNGHGEQKAVFHLPSRIRQPRALRGTDCSREMPAACSTAFEIPAFHDWRGQLPSGRQSMTVGPGSSGDDIRECPERRCSPRASSGQDRSGSLLRSVRRLHRRRSRRWTEARRRSDRSRGISRSGAERCGAGGGISRVDRTSTAGTKAGTDSYAKAWMVTSFFSRSSGWLFF